MLIEFRVENHRSIRDEQVLTMEAGRVGVADDPRPRSIEGYSKKILPVAALYGANASGKSNVLAALAFMRECVLHSHRNWEPEEGILREPFAWGQKKDEPTSLEIVFVVDRVRYQYGFKFNEQVFLEEWLYAWPHGKKQIWFTRDGDTFDFKENLKGENELIKEVTRSNALFLSAATQLKHQQLTPIYSWIGSIAIFNMRGRSPYVNPLLADFTISAMFEEAAQPTIFGDNDAATSMLEQFKALLRNADIGIVDARMIRREARARPVKFELKHLSESDEAWLPLEEESRGTQTLFRLAPHVLRALRRGRLLLVDELESSMHPNLAEHIIRQFNDPTINRRDAQLIFSTHDINLLGTLSGEPVLRRDQVWLTEKDGKGATVLYPLTDFKPRKGENLERGYVQGRYGAIPYLGDFRIPVE